MESVNECKFIFTSPTFIKEKTEKKQREFYIPRLNRENSLYGTEFEIKLQNEMTQKVIAKECAEWIKNIEGCTVHNYNDGDLIACFDENVPESVIKEIAKKKPFRAVFRDSSFENSPSKINVGEIFKLLAPETRVKVI